MQGQPPVAGLTATGPATVLSPPPHSVSKH